MPMTAERASVEFTLKELTDIRGTGADAESRLTALSNKPWFAPPDTSAFNRITVVDEVREDTRRAIQRLADEMRDFSEPQRLNELWAAALDAAYEWRRAAK